MALPTGWRWRCACPTSTVIPTPRVARFSPAAPRIRCSPPTARALATSRRRLAISSTMAVRTGRITSAGCASSRTGRDPFEVTTDCVQRCIQNTTGTGSPLEMPTGSGFYSLQPGMTWLYPSDPVVFFGNVSYLHNFPRDNVSLTLVGGAKQPLGNVQVGDVYDAS